MSCFNLEVTIPGYLGNSVRKDITAYMDFEYRDELSQGGILLFGGDKAVWQAFC